MTYITMWTYPWDVVDEGVDRAVGFLKDEVGLTSVSIATAYHQFMGVFPHNPRRPVMTVTDAAVYFQPQSNLYDRTTIKPHASPLMEKANWVADIGGACQRRGLELVSWTVCLHNNYLAQRHPEASIRSAFGDVESSNLCPSNADVREFLRALCVDLDRNYGVGALELESAQYHGYFHQPTHTKLAFPLNAVDRWLVGLCFCDACRARAEARGIDAAALQAWVRGHLLAAFAAGGSVEGEVANVDASIAETAAAAPGLGAYLDMRVDSITALYREIRASVKARIHAFSFGPTWAGGIDFGRIEPYIDRAEALAYTPDHRAVAEMTKALLPGFGPDRVVIGLAVDRRSAPDEATLLRNVETGLALGVKGYSFYNYGMIPSPWFPWVAACARRIRG